MNTTHEKRPRQHADDMLNMMRDWLTDNVPAEYRQLTAMHVRNALFKKLPPRGYDNESSL